jgi:uncharacterized protein GlcG (DUF336 family)
MTTLTLQQAHTIITAAMAHGQAMGYRPMAVEVLDASGHMVALQRADGASMFRVDIATGKAWAAVAMGVSSRELGQRAADNPNFFTALASTGQGKFIPQAGAVVIRDADGAVIGAAGASGGTGAEDEAICVHGVEAAGLRAA